MSNSKWDQDPALVAAMDVLVEASMSMRPDSDRVRGMSQNTTSAYLAIGLAAGKLAEAALNYGRREGFEAARAGVERFTVREGTFEWDTYEEWVESLDEGGAV